MDNSSSKMGLRNLPLDKWTEEEVGSWLKDVGIKECYIDKLKDEEVTGPVLISLREDFLKKKIGMKSGQINLLISNRDQLLKSPQHKEKSEGGSDGTNDKDAHEVPSTAQSLICVTQTLDFTESQTVAHTEPQTQSSETAAFTETLPWSEYRPFDDDGKDFRYIKHTVLPPETGIENLLVPCHEYKSLEIAQTLNSRKLQVKVAREVLIFACACMNMRANGTIHFGVMDKVKRIYKHGEIIGIDVQNREDFVDALDYIEKCFKDSNEQCNARKCIRNPRFIEVIEKDTTSKTFVVEYDIVPKANVVKNMFYSVGIPYFPVKDKKDNKDPIKFEPKTPYCRVGANTDKITEDLVLFIQSLKEKDQQREEAESTKHHTTVEFREDQERKIRILLTGGKKHMDDSLFYIIVTNKFHPQQLDNITFLLNMNTFCVFDFDPDSLETGLCSTFRKQKAVTPHFLDDYLNEDQSKSQDFSTKLGLFEKTSWIFCNGRNNFHQKEEPCDEKTWIKTRKKKLKKAVSFICNELLPKKSFIVLFLLMSEVEQPLVETFSEFYEEMNGHESIVVLSESKENYKKWSSQAQVSCHRSTLDNISVTMPVSHVDATVQRIQLSKNPTTRTLPVSNGAVCHLKSAEEAMLHSVDIISVDQCENTNMEAMDEDEIKQKEKYFYHGGKIDWINFWLADKHKCGDIIKREAYHETNGILERTVNCAKAVRPIESINIYHHPGSGGSTVARQLLWTWRSKVRCAVVKHCKDMGNTVCEHAVKLREHEEIDCNNCLPVLLLLEDQKSEDIDNLRRELRNVITTKNITSSAVCFILLICNRSNDPETMCRLSPSQTVPVTHKLSEDEKPLFSKKHEELKMKLELKDTNYILTFVLLSEGFEKKYIVDFVRNTLAKIDHSSRVTRLIRFVALLNCYVENSHISVSHCEASLGIATYIDKLQYHAFVDSLSEEAKLLFIDLREDTTHLSSIRIIHKLVAEELLNQISKNLPLSEIANDLITDKVLINHRFGRDEFIKFLKALFIRRNKKIRGDSKDTHFSPLIEHITTKEELQKAVDLMTDVYHSLGKDGFVAQQLARLLYVKLRFEEALKWAEEAKSCLPYEPFILDTLGQVYRRWFRHLYDSLEEEPCIESAIEIIGIAQKAIFAFRAAENAPKKETVSLNSSYYGEADVGCRLLKFLSKVDAFANKTGKVQLMKYLLTDYIPETVKKPWQKFHPLLKGLQMSLFNALELISEDLCYFQNDLSEEDEEFDARGPEQIYRPREWLSKKSEEYANFFCNTIDINNSQSDNAIAPASQNSQLQRQMMTYKLGGGNVTSILSLIYLKDRKKSAENLEEILDLYEHLRLKDLDPEELTHYIFCQIALHCIKPGSSKLLLIKELQYLAKRCITKRRHILSATGCYLVSLLFWPETDTDLSPTDSETLLTATDDLHKSFVQKKQQVLARKRGMVHFYFGKARGLYKIVHKSLIDKKTRGPERREQWLEGEIWKKPEVRQLLKRVDGWTENGGLFTKCGDDNIRVFPRYSASLPLGNERVTFYLGFSFTGVVAFDIRVKE